MSEPNPPLPSAARAAGMTGNDAGALVREGTPLSGHLFAYGTLELAIVIEKVVGRRFEAREALLTGHARYLLARHPYPAVIEDLAGSVVGTVYFDVEAPAFARLDAYEGNLYERRELPVRVGSAVMQAQCYVLRGEFHALLSSSPWDRQQFERQHLASYLARL
jgi:gamma-glutamylcyclotransferase (GGCT)/AIG2-like uncharacterized protein YtfP